MPYRLVKSADGFRGTFLFLAGLMFLPTSIGFLLDSRPVAELNAALEWLPSFVLVWHLGAVFALAGAFAALVGLFSRRIGARGKAGSEVIGWGFLGAMAPPTIAAFLQLVAVLYGGSLVLLVQAFPNVVLALAIYLASEWPNPATPLPPRRRRRGL